MASLRLYTPTATSATCLDQLWNSATCLVTLSCVRRYCPRLGSSSDTVMIMRRRRASDIAHKAFPAPSLAASLFTHFVSSSCRRPLSLRCCALVVGVPLSSAAPTSSISRAITSTSSLTLFCGVNSATLGLFSAAFSASSLPFSAPLTPALLCVRVEGMADTGRTRADPVLGFGLMAGESNALDAAGNPLGELRGGMEGLRGDFRGSLEGLFSEERDEWEGLEGSEEASSLSSLIWASLAAESLGAKGFCRVGTADWGRTREGGADPTPGTAVLRPDAGLFRVAYWSGL
mmetsp:Transcript_19485/g.32757  ORF Transcript_19485/g.32757 Transcript_19485/m.32757 type:complete len:289 (+) Transcript_19485:329-1195(+)